MLWILILILFFISYVINFLIEIKKISDIIEKESKDEKE